MAARKLILICQGILFLGSEGTVSECHFQSGKWDQELSATQGIGRTIPQLGRGDAHCITNSPMK